MVFKTPSEINVLKMARSVPVQHPRIERHFEHVDFFKILAHLAARLSRRFDVSGPAICMKFRPRSNGIGPGTRKSFFFFKLYISYKLPIYRPGGQYVMSSW